MLTDEQIARYSRQIILPAVGGRGQLKLLAASVAVVGAGEMAAAAALYLAAAGVGTLSVVGRRRRECSALETLNPDCRITFGAPAITSAVAARIVRRHDIVVDAGGVAATSGLLNAACVARCKPLVWGDAAGVVGQAAVFAGGSGAPCYSCLQPRLAPQDQRKGGGVSCSALLSGAAAAFIGTIQATEVIKLTLGMEPTLMGRLLVYDALDLVMREPNIDKRPGCAVCGTLDGAEQKAVRPRLPS